MCAATEHCNQPVSEVIVTVNGWIIDCCHTCSLALCDPLSNATSPALDS